MMTSSSEVTVAKYPSDLISLTNLRFDSVFLTLIFLTFALTVLKSSSSSNPRETLKKTS